MKRYITSIARSDAKLIAEHTYQNVSHMLKDTVVEIVPYADMVLDERLLKIYLQSLRILKFAAEALRAELTKRRIMRAMHQKESRTDFSELDEAQMPIHHKKETLATLLALLPLKINMDEAGLLDESNLKDSSLKQLKKDIERDKLIVNGRNITGSDAKLEGCFAAIGDSIDQVLRECNLPPLAPEGKELLIFCLLRNISRTHSGGVTFQALQSMIDIDSTLIIPVSSMALPLRIFLSVGSFPNKAGLKVSTGSATVSATVSGVETPQMMPQEWGLKCFVQATTAFHLKAISAEMECEDASQVDIAVRAVYDDNYYIAINPRIKEISKEVIVGSIAASFSGGQVTIFNSANH